MKNVSAENISNPDTSLSNDVFQSSFFSLLANVPLSRASSKVSNMHRVANKFAELSGNDVRQDVFLNMITDLVSTNDLSKGKALELVRLYLEKFK